MANTLTRLVERTLGRMQIARPLILPLFSAGHELEARPERVRNLTIGPPAVPGYEHAERTAGTPETTLPQPLQVGIAAATSRLAPSEPKKLTAQVVRPQFAAQTQRLVPAAAVDMQAKNTAPSDEFDAAVQQQSLPGVRAGSKPQPLFQTQIAGESSAPAVEARRLLLPLQQEEPARLFAGGIGATSNSPEPRSWNSATGAAKSPPLTVHPSAQPTTGTELSEPGSNAPAAAAPVIQVSIGRIEVRAVMRQPAPPEPAAPGPKISLQEYLRTSKGGSR